MNTTITAANILNGAAVVLNITVAIFVLRQRAQETTNQLFAAISAFLAAWNISQIVLTTTQTQAQQTTWANLQAASILFLPALCLHLTYRLINRNQRQWIIAIYVANSTVLLPAITQKLVQHNLTAQWTGGPELRLLIPIYIIEAILLIGMAYTHARRTCRPPEIGISLANCMLVISGGHDLLPLLGVNRYLGTDLPSQPLGSITSMSYALLAGYAVAHYHTPHNYLNLGQRAAQLTQSLFLFGINISALTCMTLMWPECFSATGTWLTLGIMAVTSLIGPVLFPNIFHSIEKPLQDKILGEFLGRHTHMLKGAQDTRHILNPEVILKTTLDLLLTHGRAQNIEALPANTASPDTQDQASSPQTSPNFQELVNFFAEQPHLHVLQTNQRNQNTDDDPVRQSLSALGCNTAYAIRDRNKVSFILLQLDKIPPTPRDLITEQEALGEIERNFQLALVQTRLRTTEHQDLLQRISLGLIKDLHLQITQPLQTLEKLPKQGIHTDLLDEIRQSIRCLQNTASVIRTASWFGVNHRPKLTSLDLNEIVLDCIAEKTTRARSKGATIATTGETVYLDGDPVLLRKALGALLENSIEATVPGQPQEIQINLQRRNGSAFLQITDHGTGIAQHHIHQIWEPFFSTKHKAPFQTGAGLGLTATKQIVELHHGQIRINSLWQKGTTVTIELPMTIPDEAQPDTKPKAQ